MSKRHPHYQPVNRLRDGFTPEPENDLPGDRACAVAYIAGKLEFYASQRFFRAARECLTAKSWAEVAAILQRDGLHHALLAELAWSKELALLVKVEKQTKGANDGR